MSQRIKTVLGWSYTLLVIGAIGFGVSQVLASPPAESALNCIGECPKGGTPECDADCKAMNFGGGACNPAGECCCAK